MSDKVMRARLLAKLEAAWERFPNWRLGQLVSNLQGPGPQDVFYLSDERVSELLDGLLVNEDPKVQP